MYARLVLFKTASGPEVRSRLEGAAEQAVAIMRNQKGFKSFMGLLDEATGHYGALSLWETVQDAEAAGVALAPVVRQATTAGGPPIILQVFEVVEV
jgi:heme-degrading monooxygenase HmoA